MGKALSSDLRERVYGDVALGKSRRAAARRFGVSASTGVRLARRMAETGSLAPGRQGRPRGGGKGAYRDRLIGWVETEPDISMPELASRLEAECGVVAHPASLSRLLLGAGFTVKKSCRRTRPHALTLPNDDGAGGADASHGCAKSRTGWSSSMKPRQPPG